MMGHRYTPIILFFLWTSSLFGQTAADSGEGFPEIPRGYRNLLLGMPLEQVKTALIAESRFDYRGEPDVSLQDFGSRYLISTKGRGFIKEGFFQFNDDLLYLIILEFDQEKLDFFTLQQDLTGKYGPPADISPEGMSWESDLTLLTLEYPLTVKYLDRGTFDQFIEDARAREGFTEISREEFLKDF